MARVQALNVLEAVDKKDASLAWGHLQALVNRNGAEYNVRAAKKLLSELPNE